MLKRSIDKVILIYIVAFFLWISFFAPVLGGKYEFLFISAITVILLAVLILDKEAYKNLADKKDLALCVFIIAAVIGMAGAGNPEVAHKHFWFYIFSAPFLYFFGKITAKKGFNKTILKIICFIVFLVCLYGILEFTSKNSSAYERYFNNPYLSLYKNHRIMSFHMHPAPFGTYLLAVFPLIYISVVIEKNSFLKNILKFLAAVVFMCIILTFSRGVLFGLVLSLSIILFFTVKARKLYLSYSALGFLFILIMISSFFMYLEHNNIAFYRYSLRGIFEWNAYSRKIMLFTVLGRILNDHPFFGLGLGHYRVLFDHYLPQLANITNYDKKIADCMYVTIVAETGLIGCAAFFIFIYSIIKNTLIKLKKALLSENRLLLLGFFAGFIGIMCAFLTYDGLYWTAPCYLFWYYAGVLSSLSNSQI